MRLVLLGAPGAGKGTQAKFIKEEFRLAEISTGDMLRMAIQARTALGNKIKQIMAEGRLVSDAIMVQLVKERIGNPDCANGFLLDGFPRTIPQAQALEENNILLDYVIEIIVPHDILIKRLSGRRIHQPSGRSYHIEFNPPKAANRDDITGEMLVHRLDDHAETIERRLSVYETQTAPLVQYYQEKARSTHQPLYYQVDGLGTVLEVKQRIFAILNN